MPVQLWQPSIPEGYHRRNADDLGRAIAERRAELGSRLIILGHHYQTDEVIAHADFTGDSLKLSQVAAREVGKRGAAFVVFCGVHFMAESADLLAPEGTRVILPDLSAGCSMADMAAYEDAEDAWRRIEESLEAQGWSGRVIPITYVNSTAAVKAFVGRHGGACCTSSNADLVFAWALKGGETKLKRGEQVKLLFLPVQHVGRNTASKAGLRTEVDGGRDTVLYDPRQTHRGATLGGMTPEQLLDAKVILWAGHCSVHKLFRPEHCAAARQADPNVQILVHPECAKEVVDRADLAGSTEYIIRTIAQAEPGTSWAVGTETHLVNRIAREAARRKVSVRILSDCQCLCTTMYRIDQAHLLWVLDSLVQGKVVNEIQVHPEAKKWALVALDRMLHLVRDPKPESIPALVD